MRISVFGLGYVGSVTAACLTRLGHVVVGVDVAEPKVRALNRGEAPVIEPGLDEMLKSALRKKLLTATTDTAEAMAQTDVSLICVGTPSQANGDIDLRFVRAVTQQIAGALHAATTPNPSAPPGIPFLSPRVTSAEREKLATARRGQTRRHVLIFRSTMLPGSTENLVQEFLAGLIADGRLEVFFYPEFLREGTAVEDFLKPSLAVVGTQDGHRPPSRLATIFGRNTSVATWRTAELVKYACNAFHATKITFANEIGRLGKQMGLDATAVMSLVCQDTKLNISPCYLRPGNPFGGSCLPKDVRALNHWANQQGLNIPLLAQLLPSNAQHLGALVRLVEQSGQREVIILGLSFKPNTDDLRESALVEVAQILRGRGYRLRIYDPQLNLARLIGRNKRAIEAKIPGLARLLHDDLGKALGQRGLVVVAQKCATIPELRRHLGAKHRLLDVNHWPELRQLPCAYDGFCW